MGDGSCGKGGHLCCVIRLAILASGSGTNARRLLEHFNTSEVAEVAVVGCDDPSAGVIDRAWNAGVATYLFSGQQLRDGSVQRELLGLRIDLIVLAGFLRLIPASMVNTWSRRIVNIHPALLPKYGGKGMFGHHVHEAVLRAGETESGITIHLVNEQYDEGEHLLQAKCPVLPTDTADTLAARIHALEHEHYPFVVERLARSLHVGTGGGR